LLVDARATKGWPTVFADRRGLLGALASVWEAVEPAGMTGGHLRGLFADGLEQAAVLLDEPALAAEAPRWREIAAPGTPSPRPPCPPRSQRSSGCAR
jgi:hypothetical protein